MRTASEIVDYLVRYFQEQNQGMKNLLSPKIDDLIGQMGEFIRTKLVDDTPHRRIWDVFSKEPMDNAAQLTGVLETIFEAQPAVRDRVDGFMNNVTALETDTTKFRRTTSNIENSLQTEPGAMVSDESNKILANTEEEKNPSIYLYGNEQADFESARQSPVANPFMIGKNAQIVYVPTNEVEFPELFEHLLALSENSQELTPTQKQDIQVKLQTIRSMLLGELPIVDQELTDLVQSLWDMKPEYANVLIKSLQNNIDDLPIEAQTIIIQMDSTQ